MSGLTAGQNSNLVQCACVQKGGAQIIPRVTAKAVRRMPHNGRTALSVGDMLGSILNLHFGGPRAAASSFGSAATGASSMGTTSSTSSGLANVQAETDGVADTGASVAATGASSVGTEGARVAAVAAGGARPLFPALESTRGVGRAIGRGDLVVEVAVRWADDASSTIGFLVPASVKVAVIHSLWCRYQVKSAAKDEIRVSGHADLIPLSAELGIVLLSLGWRSSMRMQMTRVDRTANNEFDVDIFENAPHRAPSCVSSRLEPFPGHSAVHIWVVGLRSVFDTNQVMILVPCGTTVSQLLDMAYDHLRTELRPAGFESGNIVVPLDEIIVRSGSYALDFGRRARRTRARRRQPQAPAPAAAIANSQA